MGGMLRICNDLLPDSDLVYIAFRLAACDTLERMVLAAHVGALADRPYGFLNEVPFLKQTPPQVQLDALVDAWSRHRQEIVFETDLVDESVVYAVCETASRIIQADPASTRKTLQDGPRPVDLPVNLSLSKQIQALHLDLSNEGDFLLISQFQDIPPDEARELKHKFGLDESAADPMFELLGRWHVAPQFAERSDGLLTPSEISRCIELFRARQSSALLP